MTEPGTPAESHTMRLSWANQRAELPTCGETSFGTRSSGGAMVYTPGLPFGAAVKASFVESGDHHSRPSLTSGIDTWWMRSEM